MNTPDPTTVTCRRNRAARALVAMLACTTLPACTDQPSAEDRIATVAQGGEIVRLCTNGRQVLLFQGRLWLYRNDLAELAVHPIADGIAAGDVCR